MCSQEGRLVIQPPLTMHWNYAFSLFINNHQHIWIMKSYFYADVEVSSQHVICKGHGLNVLRCTTKVANVC